ncbi:TrkA family potassium uptake protein [Photobacterium sp. CCB-ST2H9]|uniref:potassium channel family protein n=1 Tax=unclassified Photobacterium TaxID=2628852 RepID=UPI0020055E17|nr:TrkA family potassium uptake protein [Photobacterium sp. CCB-ST2H9]UTM59695.1 TrkA family potassium uptake protein [Photobacterium sp. CCB-ST2H9]
MAHFTVIGLGRFGVAASLELIHLGHTVTGIDLNEKIAEKYISELTQTVICDATDENALRELNLGNSEAVLVAIGKDMEASLLCTLCLKKLGVKALWVKANTVAHHAIVSKLGVTRIIHPEEEMGVRVAQALHYPMINNYISLGHDQYIVEVHLQEKHRTFTIGNLIKGLGDSIRPLLIKRGKENITVIDHDMALFEKDILLLSGHRQALAALAPRLV